MNYEETDKEYYESKWRFIGEWEKQKAPYFKKKPGIEGLLALELIKSRINSGRLLDVGCGGGRNTILFASNGFEAYGVDFSKSAVRLAKMLGRENNSSAKFSVQSVFDLRFENDFFDVVTDFGLFHHLRKRDVSNYLKRVSRMLNKKGYLILYTFSDKSKKTGNYKPFSKRNWSSRAGVYNHYYSKEEISKIFSKKFKIVKSRLIKEENRKLAFNLSLMRKY
ncbi:MAG: class I SAM-dependent methyltransferase [Nanoarchaeota archaeon]|nr:class I SAM-dependent methyltransferase [Nanoarchaeota archaeon]